jgi:hypothetical protein
MVQAERHVLTPQLGYWSAAAASGSRALHRARAIQDRVEEHVAACLAPDTVFMYE